VSSHDTATHTALADAPRGRQQGIVVVPGHSSMVNFVPPHGIRAECDGTTTHLHEYLLGREFDVEIEQSQSLDRSDA
jgi:hypothetical protein